MDSGWNSRVCAEELRPAFAEQTAGFAVVSEEGTQELLGLFRSACESQTCELHCFSFSFWVTFHVMIQKKLCFVCFDKTFKKKGDDKGVPRSHVLLSEGINQKVARSMLVPVWTPGGGVYWDAEPALKRSCCCCC